MPSGWSVTCWRSLGPSFAGAVAPGRWLTSDSGNAGDLGLGLGEQEWGQLFSCCEQHVTETLLHAHIHIACPDAELQNSLLAQGLWTPPCRPARARPGERSATVWLVSCIRGETCTGHRVQTPQRQAEQDAPACTTVHGTAQTGATAAALAAAGRWQPHGTVDSRCTTSWAGSGTAEHIRAAGLCTLHKPPGHQAAAAQQAVAAASQAGPRA